MVKDVGHLPGIDPSWVRSYTVERNGTTEIFAVLENSPSNPSGTVVLVHGNPTWSYMWRNFVRELGTTQRVIALDQLGMGFSSRPVHMRTLAMRIDDLDALLHVAQVSAPVTLIAHDWGGPVALGWATQHPEKVKNIVLFNTGMHIPTTGVPGLIQVSNTPILRNIICSQTKAFIAGALLTTGGISRTIRRAYYAPYASASRRRAIAGFVADIPTDESHVSAPVLQSLATKARSLKVPTLLVWGVRDFVFHTGVLGDVQKTFPHADTITVDTGHLSPEHPDAVRMVDVWLQQKSQSRSQKHNSDVASEDIADLNHAVRRRSQETPDSLAVFDANNEETTSWAELAQLIAYARVNLRRRGIPHGDRIAILTPFNARTIAFIYACWAEGIVPVVADPGLGIANMRRALRESRPSFVLTQRLTRVIARMAHLAYRAQRLDLVDITSQTATMTIDDVEISSDDIAAVLYTSGATGAAKGVMYTHGQLCALASAIQKQFSITDNDGIAAAYIPFALYGPAWGVAVGLPKINVLAPGKLTAHNLRKALNGVKGTILFAAPAPLRNVIKDGETFVSVRCVMSAGAPVSDVLLADVAKSFPAAQLHSPYGMTEMLIVTDGVRGEREISRGVAVGNSLPGVEVAIFPIGCRPDDVVTPLPDSETGEIFVSGPWLSVGYDQHWIRNRDARIFYNGRQWHRTGDIGHVDDGLFVEGRVAHLIPLGDSVITPVPLEQVAEATLPGHTAAAVGVALNGTTKVVLVLCNGQATGQASREVREKIRNVLPLVDVVIYKKKLPVDRRHNSKIDRIALGIWAQKKLRKS